LQRRKIVANYAVGCKVRATEKITDLANDSDHDELYEATVEADTVGTLKDVAIGTESSGILLYVDFPKIGVIECLQDWIEPV